MPARIPTTQPSTVPLAILLTATATLRAASSLRLWRPVSTKLLRMYGIRCASDYSDKLLGGIILTGGGSNMPNIKEAFQNHTHVEKIRIAKFVTPTITSNNKLINAHDGNMNTVLGASRQGRSELCRWRPQLQWRPLRQRSCRTDTRR